MTKVLLVDDDNLLVNLFTKRLITAGYEVYTANDGDEGLATAASIAPDLILLDYQMPKLDGDIMLEQLRNTDWGASIPVIMMSSVSSLDDVPNASLANAIMYKPITNSELLGTVQQLLTD